MQRKITEMFDRRLFTSSIIASLVVLSVTSFCAAGDGDGELAAKALAASGVKGGLVVHIGSGDGKLTAALHANDSFLVRGLERDAKKVAAAREHIRSLGLYGDVSIEHWRCKHLPLSPGLVNLVVADSDIGVSDREVMRVLAPLGVFLKRQDGRWTRRVKPWPADIDEWTHYLHDAGNNAVAADDRVGPPQHLQWKATPLWCRSHEFASSVNAMVTTKGRMFAVIDESIIGQPRGVPAVWTLIARDAFSGVLLWKRPCARAHGHALAAVGDRVYITMKARGPLCILDAATGKTLQTCKETGSVSELAVCEGKVLLNTQLIGDGGSGGKHIVAADADSGKVLWATKVKSVGANTMVAGDGGVCYHNGKEVVCLKLADGKELWRTAVGGGAKGYVVLHKGVAYVTGGATTAISVATGKVLWKGVNVGGNSRNPPGLFVASSGLVWGAWAKRPARSFLWQPASETRNGYDPQTGRIARTVTAKRLVSSGHHIRCYPPKATKRYLLLNKRGIEFFDLEGDNHMRHNWVRGACRFGVLPANGLLYAPPHQCFCYPGVKLTGLNALAAKMPTGRDVPDGKDADRLLKGPAWGAKTGDLAAAGDDWPTYRHDALRSGSTKSNMTPKPVSLWEVSLTGSKLTVAPPAVSSEYVRPERRHGALTPPVAAGGRVWVAEPDAHSVHCIDAADGKRLWTYVAGARVDSPPTIAGQLVLFGSTDGHAYCLRASDGALVWRFRAAPKERQITILGQLESAWPVHGSVLVRDGKVYLTAGRSSYLDGGIYAYALEIETGKVVHKARLDSGRPDTTRDGGRPFDMDGTLTDILVAGPEDIYMFKTRFNADLTLQTSKRITKLGDREVGLHLITTDGFLDKTWFNRTFWVYGRRWPGYYFSYYGAKSGQILVFDDTTTYGLKVFKHRRGHSPEFNPGGGYELFADRNTTISTLRPIEIGREKGLGFSRTELPIWSEQTPIRVHGMVLAGKRLYIAGPPDLGPGDGAFEAMTGRKGSRFRVVSAADGRTIWEFKSKRVPVFDGLIAAGEHLYMSMMDGTLVCLGQKGRR